MNEILANVKNTLFKKVQKVRNLFVSTHGSKTVGRKKDKIK